MKEAQRWNQGFETVEYTACALVDMALHARTDADGVDISEFERTELARIGMPREIVLRHRLPHFGHLFQGDAYAAGYYVYMWAEVLDCDGYEAFVEAGSPFDPGAGRAAAPLRLFLGRHTRAGDGIPCVPRARRGSRADARQPGPGRRTRNRVTGIC